jgi:hypothetical protein
VEVPKLVVLPLRPCVRRTRSQSRNLGFEGGSRWTPGLLLIWLYPPKLGVGRFDGQGVDYGGKESGGSSRVLNELRRRMSGVGGRCRIAGCCVVYAGRYERIE